MGSLPKAVVKRVLTEHAGGMRVSGPALDQAVAAAEDYSRAPRPCGEPVGRHPTSARR